LFKLREVCQMPLPSVVDDLPTAFPVGEVRVRYMATFGVDVLTVTETVVFVLLV
jgi:hypothetical protein